MLMREIEMFRAVMTAGTASKAAQLLGVSQPAVSQAIARLERHAAVPLFERVRGRLYPTQEATALLAEVNRCFVGLDAIEHRLRSLKKFGAGRIRVAAPPGMGIGFLPRVLKQMMLEERQLTVSLQIMASSEVRARLLAKECDLGLLAEEVSSTGLQSSVFARFTSGLVGLPPGHALAERRIIRPVDLLPFPFISLNPEDATSQKLDAIFRQHGVQPNILVETPYAVSVCELALQGIGVGIVNPLTAIDHVGRGLVLRRFSEELPYMCVLAMPPGQGLTDFGRQLLSTARIQLEQDLRTIKQLVGA